jgi:hypothetical protein
MFAVEPPRTHYAGRFLAKALKTGSERPMNWRPFRNEKNE